MKAILATLGSAILVLGTVGGAEPASAATTHIYEDVCQHNRIDRVDLDGSHRMTLAHTGRSTGAIGLSVNPRYVYWTYTNISAIGRADRDGTHVHRRLVGLGQDGALDVRAFGSHIYWTNDLGINRARLDGTHVQNGFIHGHSLAQTQSPQELAFTSRHIYWTNYWLHSIARADLDGSHVDWHFIDHQRTVGGIATDGKHLFWTVYGSGSDLTTYVRRATVAGTHLRPRFVSGDELNDVAVHGGYLYYLNRQGIGRIRLDGTGNRAGFEPDTYLCGIAVTG